MTDLVSLLTKFGNSQTRIIYVLEVFANKINLTFWYNINNININNIKGFQNFQ